MHQRMTGTVYTKMKDSVIIVVAAATAAWFAGSSTARHPLYVLLS
jgi:hypothetical protein